MPTSVHIPKPLLAALDRRARRLKMSRNGLIVRAVHKELAAETEWSPGFFDQLTPLGEDDARALDDVLASIRSARTRKAAPKL
jgi:hypothetical protein